MQAVHTVRQYNMQQYRCTPVHRTHMQAVHMRRQYTHAGSTYVQAVNTFVFVVGWRHALWSEWPFNTTV